MKRTQSSTRPRRSDGHLSTRRLFPTLVVCAFVLTAPLPAQESELDAHRRLYDRFFEESQRILAGLPGNARGLQSYNEILTVGRSMLPFLKAKLELDAPAYGLQLLVADIEAGKEVQLVTLTPESLEDNTLLRDPSFERVSFETEVESADSWQIRSGKNGLRVHEETAIHGRFALRMSATDGPSANIAQRFHANPGKTYSFSIYTWAPSECQGTIAVRFLWHRGKQNIGIQESVIPISHKGKWCHTGSSADAPAGTTHGVLELVFSGENKVKDVIYCDYARLFEEPETQLLPEDR